MDESLISVIIPIYNAEKYIAETIVSVINQTYPYKELIIVDDASADLSYDVVKQYACEWIHIFQLKENKGQSAASNFGYKKSTGKFIKYLDADDLIEGDYLENMFLRVTSDNHLYFSHCINFYGGFEQNDQRPYLRESWNEIQPIEFLLSPASHMRQGGRWLIPRKIIVSAGLWNESLSLINDFEYFTRLCLQADKIEYVENAVLYYRQLEHSVSSSTSLKAYESAYLSIQLSGKYLLEKENSARVKKYLANLFQALVYNIYPKYPVLVKKIQKEVKTLGGADKQVEAGGKTLFVHNLLGWRTALWARFAAAWLRKKFRSFKNQTIVK